MLNCDLNYRMFQAVVTCWRLLPKSTYVSWNQTEVVMVMDIQTRGLSASPLSLSLCFIIDTVIIIERFSSLSSYHEVPEYVMNYNYYYCSTRLFASFHRSSSMADNFGVPQMVKNIKLVHQNYLVLCGRQAKTFLYCSVMSWERKTLSMWRLMKCQIIQRAIKKKLFTLLVIDSELDVHNIYCITAAR